MTATDAATLARLVMALEPQHREAIADLARGLAIKSGDSPPEDLTLFVPLWEQHLRAEAKSPTTISAYSYHVRRLLAQFSSPNPIHVETFLTLMASTCTVNTLFQYSLAFRSFFKFTSKRGAFTMTPDQVPNIKMVARRRAAPPAEDISRLLSYKKLKPRSKALLYILTDTGPRISEVLKLKRTDIDLVHLRIHLVGKGRRERTIPISPATADAIKEHLETSRPSAYLFPGQRCITWEQHCVQTHLRRLCEKVGIKRITAHQLRHFFATQAINGGANIRSVSEILGHKSPAITLNVYCHTNDELNAREHAAHSPLTKVLPKKPGRERR